MIGASVLSGFAALKGGAGLVTIIAREESYPLIASISPPEIMVVPVKSYEEVTEMSFDSLAIGPGLGTGEWDKEVLNLLFSDIRPIVVDADALNLIAKHDPDWILMVKEVGEKEQNLLQVGPHRRFYSKERELLSPRRAQLNQVLLIQQVTWECRPQGLGIL